MTTSTDPGKKKAKVETVCIRLDAPAKLHKLLRIAAMRDGIHFRQWLTAQLWRLVQ